MSWKTHGKVLAELLGALIMAGLVTWQEVETNGVTLSEWVMVVIALFGVFVVWASANITNFNKAKVWVSAAFVVLNLLVGFLTDNRLESSEIVLLAVQFLSTLGVAAAPGPKHVVERTVIAS